MRILLIANTVAAPPNSGYTLRLYNLVMRLAAEHEVWLALHVRGTQTDIDGREVYEKVCAGIITGHIARKSFWGHAPGFAWLLARGLPLEFKFWYSDELIGKLRALVQKVDFDVVQVEESLMARYPALIGASDTARTVLTFHDVIFNKDARTARTAQKLSSRLRYGLNSVMMRFWEPRYAAQYDCSVVMSEKERELLLAINPRLNVEVVPNGVDTKALQPLPDVDAPAILFVGSMGYLPNTDGLLWFHEAIWPLIQREMPETHLWVVGNAPPPAVEALAGDDITVTGRVPEVVPYYGRCPVTVVPLRTGGGTRLKILESMALGRPVVSTTVGAEGIGAIDGEQLYLADTPELFARRTVELLRAPQRRAAMAAAARTFVEQRFDWDPIAAKQMAIYSDIGAAP